MPDGRTLGRGIGSGRQPDPRAGGHLPGRPSSPAPVRSVDHRTGYEAPSEIRCSRCCLYFLAGYNRKFLSGELMCLCIFAALRLVMKNHIREQTVRPVTVPVHDLPLARAASPGRVGRACVSPVRVGDSSPRRLRLPVRRPLDMGRSDDRDPWAGSGVVDHRWGPLWSEPCCFLG